VYFSLIFLYFCKKKLILDFLFLHQFTGLASVKSAKRSGITGLSHNKRPTILGLFLCVKKLLTFYFTFKGTLLKCWGKKALEC
jgi:hypothetical protein